MTLNILLGILGLWQIFIVLLWVLAIVLCVKRAEKQNRDKIIWGILGFFFGYIAVLVIYLLPRK